MKLYRAESLNDSPLFVRAVADLGAGKLPPGRRHKASALLTPVLGCRRFQTVLTA